VGIIFWRRNIDFEICLVIKNVVSYNYWNDEGTRVPLNTWGARDSLRTRTKKWINIYEMDGRFRLMSNTI
jgi:hypothetical protein